MQHSMPRRLLSFACAGALSLVVSDLRAAPVVPVYVAVEGQGAIRVRLTAGVVAPCDSSSDDPVYDGWLAPGRYVFYTPSWNVCMQHTFGVSREGEWSTPVILPTVQAIGWRRRGRKPLEITLSTEAPFA